MNFFDKIALNRLIKIIADFILAVLKIINPEKNIPTPQNPKPKFPWIRKNIDKVLPKK
jgi:hypothetical protein